METRYRRNYLALLLAVCLSLSASGCMTTGLISDIQKAPRESWEATGKVFLIPPAFAWDVLTSPIQVPLVIYLFVSLSQHQGRYF